MRKHVLICGMSRSGTTLLHSLLLNTLAGFDFFESELHALTKASHPRSLVTKRPLDCLMIDAIRAGLPGVDLRVIFCIRDPRSVVCSMHKDVPHDYFVGFRNQYFIAPEEGICELRNPGLKQIHQAWMAVREGVFTLRYEDLVTRPEAMQLQLFDFIGEVPAGLFTDFDETSPTAARMQAALNGQRRIDTAGTEAWRKHPLRVWNEFTENPQMFRLMEDFGYEPDAGWFTSMYRHKLPT